MSEIVILFGIFLCNVCDFHLEPVGKVVADEQHFSNKSINITSS